MLITWDLGHTRNLKASYGCPNDLLRSNLDQTSIWEVQVSWCPISSMTKSVPESKTHYREISKYSIIGIQFIFKKSSIRLKQVIYWQNQLVLYSIGYNYFVSQWRKKLVIYFISFILFHLCLLINPKEKVCCIETSFMVCCFLVIC